MKNTLALFLLIFPLIATGKIYKGAEYRTKEAYTYGRFEVRMKSAQREGMLSSFFTYHENTSVDDWNEIDIEILGRYSDDVQFNPITPGQVNHVSHYNTSFNPSLDFHTYAFEWTPTYVAWFVDGKEVHRQTGTDIEKLDKAQKIMMNVWYPQYPVWAGIWNDKILPAFAYYDWVSYSSFTPDSGTAGTDSNFTPQWKDDFDTWDQNRWEKSTHTWGGNGCDFVMDNAVLKDGMLILCLTKESPLGYSDISGPGVLSARAEQDGILVRFSEEVDSISAVNISNYLVPGGTVASAAILPDREEVKLYLMNYDASTVSSVVITGVRDRFSPPNTMSPVNSSVMKTAGVSFPLKINCGGGSYGDFQSDDEWSDSVEYGSMDGTMYTNAISFTAVTDGGVFNSELNGMAKYRIRVPNGTYTVMLMMAENYFSSAGQRVFSISIEDSVVEKNLDLFSKVGKSKPYQKIVPGVTVSDGMIDIHFMASKNTPVLNGIQVFAQSIETGAASGGDRTARTWEVGQNYPNPFNGWTTIPMELSFQDNLSMKFYDTLGRQVSSRQIGFVGAGKHTFSWDGKDDAGAGLASGVYYCIIAGKKFVAAKKLLLIQ